MTLNIFYQNAIHYIDRENAWIKKNKCGTFSFVFVIKLRRRITKIF